MDNDYRELMDQWQLDGDCSKCRRRNYCKTDCKKQKDNQRARMAQIASGIMFKAMTRRIKK